MLRAPLRPRTALAGVGIALLPGLLAASRPHQRSHLLAGARVACMALFAAHMGWPGPRQGLGAAAGAGTVATHPLLCLLWRTGVSCMSLGAIR